MKRGQIQLARNLKNKNDLNRTLKRTNTSPFLSPATVVYPLLSAGKCTLSALLSHTTPPTYGEQQSIFFSACSKYPQGIDIINLTVTMAVY